MISLSQQRNFYSLLWRPVSSSLFHLSVLGDWPDLDLHFGTKKGLRDCQQVTLILHNRICMISHQTFYFLLFLLTFTSSDIIFQKFLELHSTSDKKIFVTNFHFFNGFTQTPPLPCPPSLSLFIRGFQPPHFLKAPTP